MSNTKQALVLHLAGSNQPMLIEVAADSAEALASRLPELVSAARVEAVVAANGARIVVNFAAVQAAHVDVVSTIGQLYGSPAKGR
jgi:hypothetical protein